MYKTPRKIKRVQTHLYGYMNKESNSYTNRKLSPGQNLPSNTDPELDIDTDTSSWYDKLSDPDNIASVAQQSSDRLLTQLVSATNTTNSLLRHLIDIQFTKFKIQNPNRPLRFPNGPESSKYPESYPNTANPSTTSNSAANCGPDPEANSRIAKPCADNDRTGGNDQSPQRRD